MNKTQFTVITVLCFALGLSVFAYKANELRYPLSPSAETPIWTVEGRVEFDPVSGLPIKVWLALPKPGPVYGILDEIFVSPGYGIATRQAAETREVVWSIRRAKGHQTLYYRGFLVERGADDVAPTAKTPAPPPVPKYEEPYRALAMNFLDEVRADSADISTFAAQLIRRLNRDRDEATIAALRRRAQTPTEIAEIAIYLLQGARIPARIALALELGDTKRHNELIPYVQVHDGDEWLTFDPVTAEADLPGDMLIWTVGSATTLETENVRRPTVTYSVTRAVLPGLEVAEESARRFNPDFYRFSLSNLPVDVQNVYRILLLVPLGALIVVFMRNVIGLATAGTFAPILLALAFRETELGWGIGLFILVTSLGLAIRLYLERLKLLLVPRIAAVVVVVIVLMTAISILSNNLGLQRGLSIALFPMVILAWIVERMSIIWEEQGPLEVVKQGSGTLAVAALGYIVMTNVLLQHLAFVFPELIFVVLGFIMLLGRYRGYRLSELFRFRHLAGGGAS